MEDYEKLKAKLFGLAEEPKKSESNIPTKEAFALVHSQLEERSQILFELFNGNPEKAMASQDPVVQAFLEAQQAAKTKASTDKYVWRVYDPDVTDFTGTKGFDTEGEAYSFWLRNEGWVLQRAKAESKEKTQAHENNQWQVDYTTGDSNHVVHFADRQEAVDFWSKTPGATFQAVPKEKTEAERDAEDIEILKNLKMPEVAPNPFEAIPPEHLENMGEDFLRPRNRIKREDSLAGMAWDMVQAGKSEADIVDVVKDRLELKKYEKDPAIQKFIKYLSLVNKLEAKRENLEKSKATPKEAEKAPEPDSSLQKEIVELLEKIQKRGI